MYNISKFTKDFVTKYNHPDLIKANLAEIEHFHKALHSNVVMPLLRLFAIVLQLPDEEYLVKQHTFDEKSEDHFRYMLYHPRTEQEWQESRYGATGGHRSRHSDPAVPSACCWSADFGRGQRMDLGICSAWHNHSRSSRCNLSSDWRLAQGLWPSCRCTS